MQRLFLMLLISHFVICVQNCYMLVHIWKYFGLKEIIPKMTIMKDSCHEQSVVVAWLLVGDWSVVGGVGGDDSVRIHHVLTSQVGLTHFLQAEWRQREGGAITEWQHIQEMLSIMYNLIFDSRHHPPTLSRDCVSCRTQCTCCWV